MYFQRKPFACFFSLYVALSDGAIAGIVVGILAAVIFILIAAGVTTCISFVVVHVRKKRRGMLKMWKFKVNLQVL